MNSEDSCNYSIRSPFHEDLGERTGRVFFLCSAKQALVCLDGI